MSTDQPAKLDTHQAARAFHQAAPQYAATAKLQREVARRLVERLDMHTGEVNQILDLGSGIGFVSEHLRERYPKARIVALDLAPGMLEYAQQNQAKGFNWFKGTQQHFCCANAQQLPFAPHSFDLVLSSLMLQWCPDYSRVFAEAARVLKPEGALLFSTVGPDTLKELRAAWASVDSQYQHVHEFVDLHDLGDSLLQQGLRNPMLDIDWLTVLFNDGKHMMQQLKSIGAHNVSQQRRRGLTGRKTFAAVLEACEQFRQADGKIPATYEITYGYALGRDLSFQARSEDGVVHVPISQIQRNENPA